MRRHAISILGLALSLAMPFSVAAAQPTRAPIDWSAFRDETVRVLSDYLKINTTNPPGGELRTALFLQRLLAREGIDAQILDTAELRPAGRANLYARLKGNGSRKAIALVHHMDVVPADPRYWSTDPFSGAVKDGYVWGRGALDMKGEGIVHLMAMIAIKRSGIPLNRDIVFIANSDEELGSTGAEVFVARHADLLADVEFLITEGGDNKFERTTASAWPRSARSGSTSPSRARRRTARGRPGRIPCRASLPRSTGSHATRRRCTSPPAWTSISATSRARTAASSSAGSPT